MRSETGDKQRLLHILNAIEEIENYTQGFTAEKFYQHSMVKSACVFQIEIIGEAAARVSDEIKRLYADIEWEQMKGVRNIIAHQYWGIDYIQVWEIIKEDIPVLKQKIQDIISRM